MGKRSGGIPRKREKTNVRFYGGKGTRRRRQMAQQNNNKNMRRRERKKKRNKEQENMYQNQVAEKTHKHEENGAGDGQ